MRIGLVLAGGFAKGAYQLGALRALEQFVPKEDIYCISAASIGALNAYGYATDNLDGLDKLWRSTVSPGEKRLITGIMRGETLMRNILMLQKKGKPLEKPLYCSLLDWRNKTVVYPDLSQADVLSQRKYMRAAVSLPPYGMPINVKGISYCDGGLVDNIPVAPLLNVDLDYVICFYFDETNYRFENEYFDDRIIKISFAATSMLSHSFILTNEKIDEMIRVGYDFTMEKLSTYFANGITDLDYIYKVIEDNNCTGAAKPTYRLTVDTVISNLNRVTQKFAKRKGIDK